MLKDSWTKGSFETQSDTPIAEALTVKANEIHWSPSVLAVKMRDLSQTIIEIKMWNGYNNIVVNF